jgi:hypothetical protein
MAIDDLPDDIESKVSTVVGIFCAARPHFPRSGGSIDAIRRRSLWTYAGIDIDPGPGPSTFKFRGIGQTGIKHTLNATRGSGVSHDVS